METYIHEQESNLKLNVKIGDRMKIPANANLHPERGHLGIIVWISDDRKIVAIKCERRHNHKHRVFMMEID